MAKVTIDGVELSVPVGTLLVEAAKEVKKDIPVYCYHTKLGPAGLCRICLVEIEGVPKLQIGCNTAVTDGMVVRTQGENVEEGRRAVLELLLLNHPLDCPICDKGGECDLQDFSMAYGQGASRLADAKMPKPKAVDLGPTIVLDEERCILCLRCVRFDDIITHERNLRTEDRGAKEIITTASGMPYHSNFSGNVTELCPVGALTSKTYRFKSRPWDLHRTETSCMQCSVGCRLHIDERHTTVLRTMSVPEDTVSDGWLCDRGRYNVGFYSDGRRITTPLVRDAGGEHVQVGWDDAIAMWAESLTSTIAQHGPGAVGVIGGGRLLNEEAWLLQHVYRGLGVENIDWRAGRQRQASSGVYGGTPVDLQSAQAIVSVGRPLSAMAPVADLRLRKAVRHGAVLISVGDVPAEDAFPEIRIATLEKLADVLPASATRIAFIWDGVDAACGKALEGAIAALGGKTVHVFVAGEQPNARGAEALGCVPRPGALDVRGMLEAAREGKLRSLAILGANPLLRFPDRALVEDALRAVEFLVVSDLFATATAEFARLILPARGAFEKTGTTTNFTGTRLDVEAGLVPPEGTLADGEMLIALADAVGVALPSPDAIVGSIASAFEAAVPASLVSESLFAAAAPAAPGGGLRLVVFDDIFAGGGTVWFDPQLSELRPKAVAIVSPATAAEAGVSSGDVVDLNVGESGLRDLLVRVESRAADGTVGVLDGLVAEPANRFASSAAASIGNVRRKRVPVASRS